MTTVHGHYDAERVLMEQRQPTEWSARMPRGRLGASSFARECMFRRAVLSRDGVGCGRRGGEGRIEEGGRRSKPVELYGDQ